ncbi:hypothetical protein N7462_005193 [Penicillium macrosclerotiorum]|uniref:uncharacterized protein n=1 Tax=Penicillium macrosclerotiorum TaxID=303699 RepID=UPI0025473A77|nr:uncharacterized protein N7462_005193 [Penicillium macrosclerotiorum]KAJ5690801.1 hypothetical protein N7462_005193 [Penicillium macrosclerotiorum]
MVASIKGRDQDHPGRETPHFNPGLFNPGLVLGEQSDHVNETTALLTDVRTSGPLNSYTNGDKEEAPLPKVQVLLLCYARVIEPLAFFSIFPYVNQMVQNNGSVPDSDVGFYSGLIESLFSLTQAVVMMFWGLASDRVGRKPVLVSSLFGVALATGLFGLAKTIAQMIMFRCLAGVFAGTIVTIRTMVAEHSTPKTQARAFSWFAFSGNLGIFLGPLLGGALAEPAQQYPGIFGGIPFFENYPYALSSIVIGLVGATAAISSAFFVEETLKKKSKKPTTPRDDSEVASDTLSLDEDLSTWQLLKAPGVATVLYTYGHIMMLAFAYTAIIPVFWFTPVSLGGYGFTPMQISLMMGLNGASQAAWLLLIFPPLQQKIGTKGVIRLCAFAYPIFFLACPFGNILLRMGTEESARAFWVILPVMLAVGCGVSMSFTAIQLAINDVSPSPRVLGTLNALALTGVSALRAFCPALFTTLFALGARSQLAGAMLFGFLCLCWLPGCRLSRDIYRSPKTRTSSQTIKSNEKSFCI